jgi:hypothetical protein
LWLQWTRQQKKGKEQIEDILEEENFNFQDILGQELSDAEKEELREAEMPSEPNRGQGC